MLNVLFDAKQIRCIQIYTQNALISTASNIFLCFINKQMKILSKSCHINVCEKQKSPMFPSKQHFELVTIVFFYPLLFCDHFRFLIHIYSLLNALINTV